MSNNNEVATLYVDKQSNTCKTLKRLIEQWNIKLDIIDSGPSSRPLVRYKGDYILGYDIIYSCFDKEGSPLFGYN